MRTTIVSCVLGLVICDIGNAQAPAEPTVTVKMSYSITAKDGTKIDRGTEYGGVPISKANQYRSKAKADLKGTFAKDVDEVMKDRTPHPTLPVYTPVHTVVYPAVTAPYCRCRPCNVPVVAAFTPLGPVPAYIRVAQWYSPGSFRCHGGIVRDWDTGLRMWVPRR